MPTILPIRDLRNNKKKGFVVSAILGYDSGSDILTYCTCFLKCRRRNL